MWGKTEGEVSGFHTCRVVRGRSQLWVDLLVTHSADGGAAISDPVRHVNCGLILLSEKEHKESRCRSSSPCCLWPQRRGAAT